MSKIRIGILFGGTSKEREISFAGGRTVYDNLNKSIFEPVPVFVDSFGNFILLNWEFIYKGSIRDFYPPVEFIPDSKHDFQIYTESLGNISPAKQLEIIKKLGTKIEPGNLGSHFDFAFLCLHGANGEDGRLQGLLEYLHIPYSGSGILPSAIGIDKAVQKRFMVNAGFNSPPFFTIDRNDWISGNCKGVFAKAKKEIGFPMVIKPANQGSSIGVSIFNEDDECAFMAAVEKALFTKYFSAKEWEVLSEEERVNEVRLLADIREGLGLPVVSGNEVIYHPEALLEFLNNKLKGDGEVVLESLDGESVVLVEGFIEGKEFSCIVSQNNSGNPVALPPTEIRKGKELFDYRSKYLPGLSRKITPIDIPDEQINSIRKECERLFVALNFDVYARIDGFIKNDGTVFLNDPNTTSGMMPSSFFFHQAAEIGLNPSQFLTYIIRTSLAQRIKRANNNRKYDGLLAKLDEAIKADMAGVSDKIKIAVIFGGYSSERHISVESGRNIFEKLASSTKYSPVPVFLTGDSNSHELFQIPINLLLKDNADDIKEKVYNFKVHHIIEDIIDAASDITKKYSASGSLAAPKKITYNDLAKLVDCVFIALHGRPGEDGAIQQELEKVGLAYNGSDAGSSQITIDKYRTNELLAANGFLIARHMLVSEDDWNKDKKKVIDIIEKDIHFPFIAKPVDDGCSSAVKKIKSREELEAFATLMFRKNENLDEKAANFLHIKPKEEFPRKNVILVEELISRNGAKHFLEITGGMLTRYDEKGNVSYEVFEASEALTEGEVLSLEEKFLAGQGQNITPARYSHDQAERQKISDKVKATLGAAARLLSINGYTRIDAFVRIFDADKVEVVFIEVNSLPGMTPATCIFHQSAINGYKPYEFIDNIMEFAFQKKKLQLKDKSVA